MVLLIASALTILLYITFVSGNKIDKELSAYHFKNVWYKRLHILSYYQPFKFFLTGADDNKKTKKLQKSMVTLNLGEIFSFRGFLTLQYLLMLLAILGISLLYVLSMKLSVITPENFLLLSVVFMLSAISPRLIIKNREKKRSYFYNNEVITLQLFVLLQLKSNANIEDIFFSLSSIKTFYQETFEKAYRMSFRSQEAALTYLEEFFEGNKFGDTFEALKKISDYSRKDTIKVLQANLNIMERESLSERRREELTKFTMSQTSIVVPLAVVIFWGALPVIFYGVSVMSSQILSI